MEGPLYAREEKTVTLPLNRQFATFKRRLLMIGFGCVGQGVLPLLLRHIALEPGADPHPGPLQRGCQDRP